MESSRQQKLREYFERYANVSLSPDPTRLSGFYDASFLVAGPKGGAAFNNDDSFLAWLRELHAFNVRTGLTSMTVNDIHEVPVGAGYSLVTVTWAATFQRTGATPIQFAISYFLREAESGLKVAAYVSHEDQEDAMRARGLL